MQATTDTNDLIHLVSEVKNVKQLWYKSKQNDTKLMNRILQAKHCTKHGKWRFHRALKFTRHPSPHGENMSYVLPPTFFTKNVDHLGLLNLYSKKIQMPNRFICHKCCKSFDEKFAFILHKVSHNYEKFSHKAIHKTSSRKYDFSGKRKLQSHKKFGCDQCCKFFGGKLYLKAHKKSHSNSKFFPQITKKMYAKCFACDVCQKKFAEKFIFAKHKKLHSDTNNIYCEVCDFKTSTERNLKYHNIIIHSYYEPHIQEMDIWKKPMVFPKYFNVPQKAIPFNVNHILCEAKSSLHTSIRNTYQCARLQLPGISWCL